MQWRRSPRGRTAVTGSAGKTTTPTGDREMTIRAMNAMAGFDWLKRGINLGRNNPVAVFGGAALLLVAMLVATVVATLAAGAMGAILRDNLAGMIIIGMLLGVLVLVVIGMLMVGYWRLIDAAENGRPARVVDVFSGLGDMATSLRLIGLLVLIAIVQNVIMAGLLSVFAGGVMTWYLQMMQPQAFADPAAMMASLPSGLGVAYLVMVVVGMLFFAVQSVAIGQISLRGRGVFGAFGDGVAGSLKNVLPLLVLFVSYVVAMIVLAIIMFIVGLVVSLMGKFLGMWITMLIGIPLYLLLLLAVCVVVFGVMYHLWHDVCDGGSDEDIPAEALTA
ncbi:hypothetical protein [Lysobacter sp. A289]